MRDLRPYQAEANKRLSARYYQNAFRWVLEIPTGGGKTFTAASFLAEHLHRHERALFVVPRIDLVAQTEASFSELFSPLQMGAIQGERNVVGRQITIATMQTIAQEKRLQELFEANHGPFDYLFLDEAQGACAKSYHRILAKLAHPYTLVVGPTATPYRADGQSLKKVFTDGLCYSIDFLDLVLQGYLSDVREHLVEIPELDLSDIDLSDVEKGTIAHTAYLQRMKATQRYAHVYASWHIHAPGKRTVVFAQDVADAHAYAEYVRGQGTLCEVVVADTPEKRRAQIYEAFTRGDLKMIVNVGVMQVGLDLPCIECIIVMATMNRGTFTQVVGRGLRLSPETGKDHLVVLNATDRAHTLMSVGKLVGTTADLSGKGLRSVLQESLKEETKTWDPLLLASSQYSQERALAEVRTRSFNIFAGDGWLEMPTGDYWKVIEGVGTLVAEKSWTGYISYLKKPNGRREEITTEPVPALKAKQMCARHLLLLQEERGRRERATEQPISWAHWSYLRQRRVGHIGHSHEEAVKGGMTEGEYQALAQQLKDRGSAHSSQGWVLGPITPKRREAIPA